jgi:hypothetical protein
VLQNRTDHELATVQVGWQASGAAAPMGQFACFIEFLGLAGLGSRWTDTCPLICAAPSRSAE